MEAIDYRESLQECMDPGVTVIAAHGQGKNCLILIKREGGFEQTWRKRTYPMMLEHRSLSKACGRTDDEAWACVDSSEDIFVSRKDMPAAAVQRVEAGEDTLFDHFELC